MKLLLNKLISITVIVTMLFATNTLITYGEDGEDVTDMLYDMDITVEQDGIEMDNENGDKINSDIPIDIQVSFKVPVIGDGVSEYVDKNDVASFEIASGFQLIGGDVSLDLEAEGTKVGTLTLYSDVSNKVMAQVVFDGDDSVFTDVGENWSDVTVTFTKSLEYDKDNYDDGEGDHEVALLQKTYIVNVPPLPIIVSGEKTGVRSGQYIDWKIEVEAKKGEDSYDLAGYVLNDDITDVGTYVEGTFMVGTSEDGTGATYLPVDFLSTDTELNYVFPDNSDAKQYIFFRTKISDDDFYTNGNKTITNEVTVTNEGEEVFSDDYDLNYNVTWISKNVVSHNDYTGEVVWSITANQLGATLNNAVIADDLDDRLINVSATLQKWDSDIDDWGAAEPITQNGNDFELGDINMPVLLKITGYVDTDNYNIGHTIQTIGNTASIRWDGQGPISANSTGVDVGVNPISKSNPADYYNLKNHTVDWEVNIVDSDVSLNLRVMDLLVYQNSGFDVNDTYDITDNSGTALTQVTLEDIKELKPSYNQRYYEGSFESEDGLELTVHKIVKDGKILADLLVVTGPEGAGIDATTGDKSFSYSSQITNPNIYLGVANRNIVNTATLFSGNTWINEDEDTASYRSRMLRKDMLTRDAALDIDTFKNSSRAGTDDGFNYIDKTAVFRLHINYNDIDDVESDINMDPLSQLGAITVTDSLPDGWEFVEVETGKMFKLYEATPNSDGYNLAGDEVMDYSSFMTADFETSGQADFQFSQLSGPYVIIVKAKMTDEKAEEYFSNNDDETDRNLVRLKTENWSTGISRFQDILLQGDILTKNLDNFEDGAIRWTVDYMPYGIERLGTEIEDTLDEGIDLRINSLGELDLTDDNITVKEITLNADGTYSEGDAVQLTIGDNIFYNNETRKLRFVIPDNSKAYRFEYVTDVTGNSGDEITNSVRLLNSTADPDSVVKLYSISRSDVSVTMTKSGWIEITKIDNEDSLVEGAEYTVFAEDGETIIRRGLTDADGKLTIRGLPVGEYILKETKAPDGYNLSEISYDIAVTNDGTVKTSIDGKTGDEANIITLENAITGTSGNLLITKTLDGNANETDKEFDFIINIEGLNGDYSYVGVGEKGNGIISFVEGMAGFSLKGGEGINIINLPKDLNYSITEKDYTSEGYSVRSFNESGDVAVDETVEISFVNTKNIYEYPEVEEKTDEPLSPETGDNRILYILGVIIILTISMMAVVEFKYIKSK
jgi:hypothetical protein